MLERILSGVKSAPDPRVLIGFDKADDAGVYLLDENTALIQTVDFFTPIVDDPFVFGQIAAANALSDVYAMGGKPLVALSILAVSTSVVEEDDIRHMLSGGVDKMNEAGVPVIGGHSIRDNEAKLGYCVSGTARPDRIFSNAGARPGDVLLLTKPLGTGIIATALKAGKAGAEAEEEAVKWMCTLNRVDPEVLSAHEVHAITDITGFGLIGHATEMARASEVFFQLSAEAIPVIPGAMSLAARGFLPGGLVSNRDYFSCAVDWNRTDEMLQHLAMDPQTSGGLLISLPGERAEALAGLLREDGFLACIIGKIQGSGNKRLEFI